MKPRIGIFDSSREASGISRHVRSLVSGIDPSEFDVTVFCRGDFYADLGVQVVGLKVSGDCQPEDSVTEVTPPRGLRGALRSGLITLSPAPVKLIAGFGRDTLQLAALLRAHAVDLLHVQLVGADEAALAARMSGIRGVLGTLHIDSSQSGSKRWPVETMTNHCLDRAIAVSRATAADWIRRTALPTRCVTVIPNGVGVEHFRVQRNRDDARQALGITDPSTKVIAALGRLSVQKGFSFLLEAVSRLKMSSPNVLLLIAGDGPLRETLAGQAAAMGIAANVRFLGTVADVRPLLEAADVFALPSLWEAMPYALLEAMAMGVPPVATCVAGVPEVIEHGRCGLLVHPRDVTALAAALHRVLNDQSLRDEFSKAARRRIVEHFDERTMITQIVNVYRQMTSRVEARRRRASVALIKE